MQSEYLRGLEDSANEVKLGLKRKSYFYGGCVVVSNFQDHELPKVICRGER